MMRDVLDQLTQAKNRNLIVESRVDGASDTNDSIRSLTVKFHTNTHYTTVNKLAEFFAQTFAYSHISQYCIGKIPYLKVTFKYPIPRQ